MKRHFEHIGVKPLGPVLGAEVFTSNHLAAITDGEVESIKEALAEFKVLFFREAHFLDGEYEAFAERIGFPAALPIGEPAKGTNYTLTVRTEEGVKGHLNQWHTGFTWLPEPMPYAMLRALELPSRGGDTLWRDMTAIYDAMPPQIQDALLSLAAWHKLDVLGRGLSSEQIMDLQKKFPAVQHPVVREGALYINPAFTYRFANDFQQREGLFRWLMNFTMDKRDYEIRWKWQRHDLALWCNTTTQHYACADYYPQGRHMERISFHKL